MLSRTVVRTKLLRLSLTKASAVLLVVTVAVLLMLSPIVLAHGGEDHGDQKSVAPATAGQMNTKLATVDGYEVLVKYPTPKPAEETPLRLFITDSKTNAPLAGVSVAVVLRYAGKGESASSPSFGVVHADATSVEATATPTDTLGIYEAHVVFPEVGQYDIALKLAGASVNKELSITGVVVPATAASSSSSRTIPVALILLFAFLLISATATAYLLWLRPRRLPRSDVVAASTYSEALERQT